MCVMAASSELLNSMKMWERRQWAMKNVRSCPECETEQVQLTDWRFAVLKFKCRKCHYRFEVTTDGSSSSSL